MGRYAILSNLHKYNVKEDDLRYPHNKKTLKNLLEIDGDPFLFDYFSSGSPISHKEAFN